MSKEEKEKVAMMILKECIEQRRIFSDLDITSQNLEKNISSRIDIIKNVYDVILKEVNEKF